MEMSRVQSRLRWLLALGAVSAASGCGAPEGLEEHEPTIMTHRGALTQVTGFGTNPGNLVMYKYVPAGAPANAPLVVALHGCAQTAAAYEAAGWTALADVLKFHVVYPEQQTGNNSSRCFNWFELGDTARGQGEALSIKQMVDKMKADHSIDGSRVFVTGLSAGGGMTSVMAATYPDVFSGAAIMSGLPYRCATSLSGANSCMNPGVDKTPDQWGTLVRGAYSGYAGPWPKVSIWHGTSDFIVQSKNLTEMMEQWTNVHGIDATADVTETVATYPHKVYADSAGNPKVETYELTGKGHGTAVDPQFSFPGSAVKCGTAGAYLLDVDICSTWYVAQFFGLTGSTPPPPSDTTPPTVNVTAPTSGATVSGTVSVTATASDNVAVTRVEFYVNGSLAGTDTTSPYTYSWDSTQVANGSSALMARAFDAAGNAGTDDDTSVTVSNSGTVRKTATFSSISAEDGYVKANADGTAPAIGTLTTPATGRGTDGKQNRALFSFDTSSLPDTANVVRVTLRVTYSSASGDPWSNPAGNTLVVDVQKGTFGAATVETTDWAATPTASAVATLARFTAGTQTSSDFSAAGLSAINLTGRTQTRLRFSLNPTTTHYLFLTEGAGATLTVEYE